MRSWVRHTWTQSWPVTGQGPLDSITPRFCRAQPWMCMGQGLAPSEQGWTGVRRGADSTSGDGGGDDLGDSERL